MNENNKEILSQKEIDALLKSDEQAPTQLTGDETDVIGEVGNISMGAAATALHNILDQSVQITTPEVSITSLEDVMKEYEKPCVLVDVEYLSGLQGVNLFVVNDKDAATIADLMLGGDGKDPSSEIGEIQLSALGEAMNQMMGSASTSMSQIFNRQIEISPPRTEYLTLEDKVDSSNSFNVNEEIVRISFRISIGDLVDSTIMQLMPLEFCKDMVQKLVAGQLSLIEGAETKKEEPETTPSPEKEEASMSQETPDKGNDSKKVAQPSVEAQKMDYQEFSQETSTSRHETIDFLRDIPLEVTVRLGRAKMTIKEILELGKGSIIELDRLAGEDVDLLVNGKLIAKGEVVVIEENFAFRIKKIISPMERIKELNNG